MLKALKLQGVGPVNGLKATFGDRLNVLTGDNGLGKSFLLDVCFWTLTGIWPGGRIALPSTERKKGTPSIEYEIPIQISKDTHAKCRSNFDFATQSWSLMPDRPKDVGLVIYAAVDGSFTVWDSARNLSRAPQNNFFSIYERPSAYEFNTRTLANGLKDEDGETILCNGLIQDWVNWYYERASKPEIDAFQYLEDVIAQLSDPMEPMKCGEPRRVFVDRPLKYPVLKLPYGDVAFPQWSAGMRRIISFAYLLVWAWYENRQAAKLTNVDPTNKLILILDEIESHLHPKWQRTILPALLDVASKLHEQFDVQIFTATHSPLILASLETRFDVEKDKLFWFDMQELTVSFQDYPWAIQGDVVGWLTSEIFGLRQARSREGEIAIEAAEAFMRGDLDELPDGLKTKDDIHHALRQSLPGLDPFWPRWIVEVKP